MHHHYDTVRFFLKPRPTVIFVVMVDPIAPPKRLRRLVSRDSFQERHVIYILLYPRNRSDTRSRKSKDKRQSHRYVAVFDKYYTSSNNPYLRRQKIKWTLDANDYLHDVSNIMGYEGNLKDDQRAIIFREFVKSVEDLRKEAIAGLRVRRNGEQQAALCLPDIKGGKLSMSDFFKICNAWKAGKWASGEGVQRPIAGTSVVPAATV
jgi:hypothetical protein